MKIRNFPHLDHFTQPDARFSSTFPLSFPPFLADSGGLDALSVPIFYKLEDF